MAAREPKEIAELAAQIYERAEIDPNVRELATLVAELAMGLDVFFSTLKELGEKKQ